MANKRSTNTGLLRGKQNTAHKAWTLAEAHNNFIEYQRASNASEHTISHYAKT